MASSQYLGRRPSPICSKPLCSWIITGLFRTYLTNHFSAANLIEEPDLRGLVWTPNKNTKILIESNTRWLPELTQARPGIIIKRNDYKNYRVGIGDLVQGPDSQGNRHYETFWIGSHTLFAIAGEDGMQAELLGLEVQRELTEFALEIAKDIGLLRLQVTDLGAPAKLEESRSNWVVPVTVGYTFGESWKISVEAARLNAVGVQAELS